MNEPGGKSGATYFLTQASPEALAVTWWAVITVGLVGLIFMVYVVAAHQSVPGSGYYGGDDGRLGHLHPPGPRDRGSVMVTETLTDSTPARVETPAPSPREGPRVAGIGRFAVRGGVIGFLAWVVIVTGAARLAGVRVVNAIGVATVAGGWVGLGMGAMFGASFYADRVRDADQTSRLGRSSMSPWHRASGHTA